MLGISGWLGLCGPGAWSLLPLVLYSAAREQVSWCFQVLEGVCPIYVALGMESIKRRQPCASHILPRVVVTTPEAAAAFLGVEGAWICLPDASVNGIDWAGVKNRS